LFEGVCSIDPPWPEFREAGAFRVLLTRMAGPSESVRTAQDQWLPGEKLRVRQIGMTASNVLRGTADGLPGHQAMEWVRTTCFVQGPGAAKALGRAAHADVVIWGQADCTAGDAFDLSCARKNRPREIRAGLTVLAELPQARPDNAGWRPAPLPHALNWGLPVRDLDQGTALLNLVQGLERLQQGAPSAAAHLFQKSGPQAASLRVDALLLAGDMTGARQAAEVEVAQARTVGGSRLARALVAQAGVHGFRDRQPMARRDLQEAIALATAAQDRPVAAYATLQLALLHEQVGDYAGAEQTYASLVEHVFLSHDRELRAEVWAGLGRSRQAQGKNALAHEAYARALPAWEDGSDPWALATILDGLATTGGRFEMPKRAAWLVQAEGLWTDLGQSARAMQTTLTLVALAAASDAPVRESRDDWITRLEHAQSIGRRAIMGLQASGKMQQAVDLRQDLARIAMHLGDVPTALSWLEATGAAPADLAVIERGLAEALRKQRDGPGALSLYLEAMHHAEQAGLLREQATIAGRIADLCRKVLRDVEQAQTWSERALELHRQALDADEPPPDAASWSNLGDLAMFARHYDQALTAYLNAETLDLETPARPDPQLPCKAGRALFELQRYDESVWAYERGIQVAAARNSTGLAISCQAGADRAREAARRVD
jgi:tetratricopeptide (TPR) repeat protein